MARLLVRISLFACLVACETNSQEPDGPVSSLAEAEKLIAGSSRSCGEAVFGNRLRGEVEDAIATYWDAITASAFAVTQAVTTAVPARLLLNKPDFRIDIQPHAVWLQLPAKHLDINWDTRRITINVDGRFEEWLGDWMVTSPRFWAWTCAAGAVEAAAWASEGNVDSNGDVVEPPIFGVIDVPKTGDLFGFFGKETDSTAKVSLEDINGHYRLMYCEPVGCGRDSGDAGTITRLTHATLGAHTWFSQSPAAFHPRLEEVLPLGLVELRSLVTEHR